MGVSTTNLFSIILIVSVVFILFLSSPVYKIISGEGSNKFPLIEGMTSSEASSLGLTGDGSSNNPYIIPQKLIVRPRDSQWKEKIQNEDKNETGITPWSIDDQFKTEEPQGYNQIGNQYRYFAEWWLAKYNPKADANVFFAANVRGNNYSNSASDYGLYKFAITGKNSDGSINYTGFFNGGGWGWTSQPLSPAPTPVVAPSAPSATASAPKIPDPKPIDKSKFGNKKCNNASTRDGNCIPVCVPLNMEKVAGKAYDVTGPDGLPFNQNTANYFYERPVGGSGSGGEYYPITNSGYSRIIYGSFTDCTQDYACSPSGLPGSDGSKASCNPAAPPPSRGCDPSCTKVKNPRLAGGACKLDKSSNKIVCYPCPIVDGEINCNDHIDKCGGCGNKLIARFDPGKDYPSPEPKEKPYTETECQRNCDRPGVEIFQNYLNTFRDGSGFDDGSCQIIGRDNNMIKCRPVRKSMNASNTARANGGMKPIPAPDQCVLCEDENLQGYVTFERKWDDYAKQNDYVNVKLIDKPRGASYGPSDGSRREENWERWDDDGDDGGTMGRGRGRARSSGWRRDRGGDRGGDGWYQSMSDAKSKSFQVAAANADSSRQQAYIESLKLELNKLNDEYTTQQAAINKMKENIDKHMSDCQDAKSKLSDAMMSNVSDDMNKNAAITMKEKIDANAKSSIIATLQQNVKSACDAATELSNTYNASMKQLGNIDTKRQALIEKLVIAMNKVTENKTTININLGGGGGGDCGDRLGCGTGIQYNNMYTNDYFKPQRISDMVKYNYNNIPMPYQDIILF